MNILYLISHFVGWLAALLTLPGTLELAALTIAGMFYTTRRKVAKTMDCNRIAVLIPAHNEQAGISGVIGSLHECELPYAEVDIIVIADNCADATAEHARRAGARVLVRHNLEQRGKGYALDFAFTELVDENYDAYLIVDADTRVSNNFLVAMYSAFVSGAEAVQCGYRVSNPGDSVRTRLMDLALCGFNLLRPRGRSRLGLSCGIYGNGFGLTRETIARVPYTATSVVEDLEYHMKLVGSGICVAFIGEAMVLGEMPAQGNAVKTQRARWEGGRILALKEEAPRLLNDILRGRLRLLEPLLDLLLLPLTFHITLLCVTLLASNIWTRIYCIAAFAIVALHLVVASFISGRGLHVLRDLAIAPLYMAWKIFLVPALFLQARKNSEWVRTARISERHAK
jgi:cellulose synthase/poly-beta-1,6-N-acetylglucosamine synthase-like glycosyltransferase